MSSPALENPGQNERTGVEAELPNRHSTILTAVALGQPLRTRRTAYSLNRSGKVAGSSP